MKGGTLSTFAELDVIHFGLFVGVLKSTASVVRNPTIIVSVVTISSSSIADTVLFSIVSRKEPYILCPLFKKVKYVCHSIYSL